MGIIRSGAQRRTTFAALLALATFTAGAAAASGEARGEGPVLSELRIEGPKGSLDPGTWYATGTEELKRSRGLGCRHRKGAVEVPGATALGIAETAAGADADLQALRVRRDDFGLFVCEIGGLVGRPFDHPAGFSGWTYWVDFAGGVQAAENEALAGGERVLWVFSDFGERNINTGNALELAGVPAYDADGTFEVEVLSHAYGGDATGLPGAKIEGAEDVDDLGGGAYEVTVPAGRTTLFAKHKPDIPSNRMKVCVRTSAERCPAAHGRAIVGATSGDVIEDTAGWDRIRARGGGDEISIESGGRDEVDCGRGPDLVLVNAGDDDDLIAANCEQVEERVP
jgi:hypothetical protein